MSITSVWIITGTDLWRGEFSVCPAGYLFWMKAVNGLNVIAEYDSYSVNCGIGYNFWKDYISGVVELTQCKYPSAGMVFRIHLK